MLVLLEGVGEAGQLHVSAEPAKFVAAQLGHRFEMLLPFLTHAASDAVSGDHQVGIARDIVNRRRVGAVHHLHTQLCGTNLQNAEHGKTAQTGEAVTARSHHVAFVTHVNVVPIGEALGDVAIARLVRPAQVLQGLVGEHDAEAEGIGRRVAFDYANCRVRVRLLDQDGGIQTRRAATQYFDFHRRYLPRRQSCIATAPLSHCIIQRTVADSV